MDQDVALQTFFFRKSLWTTNLKKYQPDDLFSIF